MKRQIALRVLIVFLACASFNSAQAQGPAKPPIAFMFQSGPKEPVYNFGFDLQKNRILDIHMMWVDNGGQDLRLIIRTVLTTSEEKNFREQWPHRMLDGVPVPGPSRVRSEYPVGVYAFYHEARSKRTGEQIWSRTAFRATPAMAAASMPVFQKTSADVPSEVIPRIFSLLDRIAARIVAWQELDTLVPDTERSLLQGRLYASTSAH